MKQFWRIYHDINEKLSSFRKGRYLEIGTGNGLNIRNVKSKSKFGVGLTYVDKEWLLCQWQIKSGDFLDFFKVDDIGKFEVIFLRDWDNKNLEERIRKSYDLLADAGILYVDGIDVEGNKNEAWKMAVGLSTSGIACGYLKDKYLVVYKTDSEAVKITKSRMKFTSYLKIKDSFKL